MMGGQIQDILEYFNFSDHQNLVCRNLENVDILINASFLETFKHSSSEK